MAEYGDQTRRSFLAISARIAAAAGLMTTAGRARADAQADRGPALKVTGGPKPKAIDPSKPIRLGIVGAGGRAGYVLRQMFEVEPNMVVVAIADPQQGNIDRMVNDHPERIKDKPASYNGPDEYKTKLLAREDVDAVLLATPCHLHAPMYLDCFAAGKHFYGEKPMAITVNEARAMREAQAKNPEVIGHIGFQRRATELYHKGIGMVRDDVTGGLLDCRAAWNNSWGPLGKPGDGPRIWFGRRAMSGDWMLEQACHTWDVLNWVAGKLPVAVSGFGYKDTFKEMDPERDVTDLYYAHLEYPDFVVDYEHSWICPPNDEGRFTGVFERFSGLKGGIALNEGKFFPRDGSKPVVDYADGQGDPKWTQESVRAFFASLRERKPAACGVNEGYDATLVGLLVRRAVDERRRVTMKELLGS